MKSHSKIIVRCGQLSHRTLPVRRRRRRRCPRSPEKPSGLLLSNALALSGRCRGLAPRGFAYDGNRQLMKSPTRLGDDDVKRTNTPLSCR